MHRIAFLLSLLVLSVAAFAQDQTPASPAPPPAATDATAAGHAPEAPAASSPTPSSPTSFSEVLDRVVEHEHLFMAQMRHMHPLIETYLQNMKQDRNSYTTLLKDQYFLGRLDITGTGLEDTSFMGQPGFGHRMMHELTNLYALHFLPLGFAQMVVLDPDFQKKYYNFTFVRREFLV